MSVRRLLAGWFYRFAPRALRDGRTRAVLVRRARELDTLAGNDREPAALWRALRRFPEFLPLQREGEILRLLELVSRLAPARICEIGTASGGTTFLLARMAAPGAVLVTLDLSLRAGQAEALAILGGRSCRVRAVAADSHDPATVATVRAEAGGPLDLLLVDGDHSYDGVKTDFDRYAALVRPGGLIALHDIMPDSRSRGGPDTGTDAGGVPRFWRELSARHRDTVELIEDPAQDACGIGVVTVTP